MDFRDFGEKRSVQRPNVDAGELAGSSDRLTGPVDVAGERFDGADFTGVTGGGEIHRSVLEHVGLSESRFEPLILADVVLRQVEVSNAAWSRVTARRVEVLSCRATGWQLMLGLAWDLYVADTQLSYASLTVERVKGLAVFERCSFAEAVIRGDLSNVLFLDCDFAGAEFAATAARDCDLRSSRLVGSRGLMSLRGARVSMDQAISVADRLAVEAGLRPG